MCNKPLISICVLTYNSSKFIKETLESIKEQTYENIELIISDDHSTDDTVNICEQWIDLNKNRFVHTEIITISENTGISANSNRSRLSAKGEWIKGIAGDDMLINTCIEDNYEYVRVHSEIDVLQSNSYLINEKSEIIGSVKPINKYFKRASAYWQHQILLRKYEANTTSTFIRKNVYDKVGYYDESIRNMEDTQMWLRLTYAGVKIHFFEAFTTKHRLNFESVSYDKKAKKINYIHFYAMMTSKKYVYPHLNKCEKLKEKYRYFATKVFYYSIFNKKGILGDFFWRMFTLPVIIYNLIIVNQIYCKVKKSM